MLSGSENTMELLKYSIMFLILVIILFLLASFYFRQKRKKEIINDTDIAFEYETEVSDNQQSLLQEYKKAVDLSVMVSKADIDGNITYVNDLFCKISGYSREEIIGRNHNLVNNPNNPIIEFKNLWDTISSKKVYKGTIKNITKDGEDYYIDITIMPILDKNNNITEYLALSYNVTEHIQALDYAYKDQLTEVSNKHKFEEIFIFKLKQMTRNTRPFCIVILDIDHFKKVNGTFGHLEGDKVLVMIANALQTSIRESDFLARWGGEEFILLLNDIGIDNVFKVVEKLRHNIELLSFDPVDTVTASFGVTQYTESDLLEDMISRADKALYKAKEDGRNCIRSM